MVKATTRTVVLTILCLVLFLPGICAAGPEAHLLRIDPRTSVHDGDPTITTVIDLSQTKRIGQLTSQCATLRGDEELDCIAQALEQPNALSEPVPFPEEKALLTIRVGDTDFPAELVSHARFGESQQEPRMGTAWVIVLDADDRMGAAFDDAAEVALSFLESLGPQDLATVLVLSDRQIALDSGWASRAGLSKLKAAVTQFEKPLRSQGRTRPLLDLIKQAASDSFRGLQSPGEDLVPPLHQAMVVLSSGYGGGDPSTSGPGATQLSKFLTEGRFDEKNTALVKLPVPVVSIYSPPKAMDEHRQIARTFMENLANPIIGGFFTVLRPGDSEQPRRIVDAVRSRFSEMIVARFSLSCVAPSITQSFSLVFRDAQDPIAGDNTFQNVPLGFEPSEWPLDVDVELTREKARAEGGVYPGGRVRVFGNFCWGTDIARPEAYFIPPGESLPQDLSSQPGTASAVQKRLVSLDMRSGALEANGSFAEFQVPEAEQVLHGEGERSVVRLVVVDSKMRRTSGLTESSVLTLQARKRPFPIWPIASAVGGVFSLLVILGLFLRRGSRNHEKVVSRSHSPTQESPYATPAPVTRVPKSRSDARATLEGAGGRFTVLSSSDLRCGRDASRCAAVLSNPQVSGLHATFRMEGNTLLVRDEGSTSGTKINESSIEPGKWLEVSDGDEVSLGPEKLRVSWEQKS